MEFQLRGFDQLDRRLKALPDKVERRVMRTALRSTAGKIATRVKRGTPKRTGLARRNVKTKTKASMKTAEARVHYKSYTNAILHAREYGSRGRGRRTQRPRPFFDHAIAGWEQEALTDLREGLRAAVEKAEAL